MKIWGDFFTSGFYWLQIGEIPWRNAKEIWRPRLAIRWIGSLMIFTMKTA
jgi:hypothetical protein